MVRRARATSGRRGESRRRHVPPLTDVADAFRDHDLFTFSSALALRVLASLVPLTLLGLALLAATGREDLWRSDLGPAVQERVTFPVYRGIDYSVERIFNENTWPLIGFATALSLWHVSRGMRIVMKALNVVHDTRETRRWRRLIATDLLLALSLIVALTAAFLIVVSLPRLAGGVPSILLQAAAWIAAAVLFSAAVALLVRYAPAEHPEPHWASLGSLVVVVVWVLTSLLFGWWAGSIANYKSAVGALAVFLVLTTYVLTSTTIFLVGVQLDELARKGGRR